MVGNMGVDRLRLGGFHWEISHLVQMLDLI